MSVTATCPECSAAASVPDEMVGKKVRCKKCKAIFPVKASKGRPASKERLTSSGRMERPKKSNALLWVTLILIVLIAAGGAGGAFWYVNQQEPEKQQAKSKGPKADAPEGKKVAEGKSPKTKEGKKPVEKEPTPPEGKKPVEPKKGPPEGEVKNFEPMLISAISASTPVELKELNAIKGIVPISNRPEIVGLHTVEDKTHYFEMYDLKKQQRLAKVKLASDVDLLDVDPDGTVLATTTHDRRVNVYTLPAGGLIADEWNPYDDRRDMSRFLPDRGGKMNYIAMLTSKDLFVMTSGGFGDVWQLPARGSVSTYMVPDTAFCQNPEVQRTEYRKPTVEPNKDFVLSPDRTLFAFATDAGIGIYDAKNGKKLGATPKMSKYGSKVELIGMGFEPGGTKLAVYFSAGKADGRTTFHARYAVPSGEQLFADEMPKAGQASAIEFVNGDFFMALDHNLATVRDGRGKLVAECRIPIRSSQFAPRVVNATVAYTFVDDRQRPVLGLANVPLGEIKATLPEAPPKEATKDKSLIDLFSSPKTTGPEVKARTFEFQEIWEFGAKGIYKKGVRTFESK